MKRFPAEWERQSAVMIAWPHRTGDFGNMLNAVEETFCDIAGAISRFQQLIIVCRDDAHQEHIQCLLQNSHCRFIQAPYDDIWVRDTAPLTIKTSNGCQLLNFRFNGWGEKYPCQSDNALSRNLFKKGLFDDTSMQDVEMVLEGGSIETDGQGTLLTTRQCLLSPNRNPGLSIQEIETVLKHCFGLQKILWLDQNNLAGDDTDAHIDTLARLCSPDSIAYSSCDDPEDQHYIDLKHMESQLRNLTSASGKKYTLTPLPLPKPVLGNDGERLPANYANFLVINNAVLVPIYNDPMDNVALQRLSACFPDREIIAIPCTPLIKQYGSLHCMTMQFPESVIK